MKQKWDYTRFVTDLKILEESAGEITLELDTACGCRERYSRIHMGVIISECFENIKVSDPVLFSKETEQKDILNLLGAPNFLAF